MSRLATLTLSALGILIAWRMLTFTPPNHQPTGAHTAAQDLFEGLVDSGQLVIAPDAQLQIPPPDAPLAAAWRGETRQQSAMQQVRDLYGTAAGMGLQDQIKRWNRSRRLAAVRDNGAASGVTHAVWRAYDCKDDRLIDTPASVDASFGYVHQGRLRLGFSPWTAVASESDCIEWRGEFKAAGPLPLKILYVGRFMEGMPAGRSLAHAPPPAWNNRPIPSCLERNAQHTDQVGEWRIPESVWRRVPQGGWRLSATLRLHPARNPSLSSQGLRVGVSAMKTQDEKIACKPVWHAPRPGSGGTPAIWSVTTIDGVSLLDPDLHPTPEAERLGLIPLVGYGPEDYYGLGAMLGTARPGAQLTLTLDSRLQTAANAALTKKLKELDTQDSRSAERRAALVILRSDGAILAAAGHPQPPPLNQVTNWDLTAFSRVYPLANPLQMRAWEGVDRHQAAGSTLKPLIALAGLEASADRPQIDRMLRGLSVAEFKQLTGLDLASTRIDPYAGVEGGHPSGGHHTIKNFAGETLQNLLTPSPSRPKATCPGQSAAKYDLSVASALRESLNTWFSALALQLDGAAADRYQNDPRPLSKRPRPDLRLIGTMRQLGFGSSRSLLAAPPASLGERSPQMSADRIDLLGETPTPLRWIIAQSAIGQGVLVTPLRMATLAATLSDGAIVRPHLDAAWGEDPVRLKAPTPLGVDLSLIRRGMRDVVQAGTAAKAFSETDPEIWCNTYAKTGTADVAQPQKPGQKEQYGTAWLIGWHQPPGGGADRLAFACMVTHTQGFGGDVCGSIVADLLSRIPDSPSDTDG
ncbi:penicillin-binding transpeptidase domain-containing protein [Thiorhodococcus fuscus]|uniref:beta-lactamase n=1 Tax=Thiorhodococcus fuscus TaxID=527200 RepID=A0ABW4Y4G9_9GAMM